MASSLFHDPALQALAALGVAPGAGLAVHSPLDGGSLPGLTPDTPATLAAKAEQAAQAQRQWQGAATGLREAFCRYYAEALKANADPLKTLIVLEAGKTQAEAAGEVNGAASVLLNTLAQAAKYPAPRAPVGVVGLITSFNFPFAVAHWTIAPALLAGNAVLWKPSEKTPLVAVACDALFRRTVDEFNAHHRETVPQALMQVIIGGREIGQALMADERVDMVSATGSVAMGQGIKRTLAGKRKRGAPPVLELGGNNAAVMAPSIGEKLTAALDAVFFSALASSGQRCTDTRRLFVPEALYDASLAYLRGKYQAVLEEGKIVPGPEIAAGKDGFGPLIDADAYARYRQALQKAVEEGGVIYFGNETYRELPPDSALRLYADRWPQAYYVKPALVAMPGQREGGVMHEETFAPVLYLLRYEALDDALALANAPANSGLVQALYAQDGGEKRRFLAMCGAGHAVINSRTGTGTPAHGLGFGGRRDSGEGEILGLDPLRPFVREPGEAGDLPSADKPEMVTEGEITRWKYIVAHPDGTRTRVVEHSF